MLILVPGWFAESLASLLAAMDNRGPILADWGGEERMQFSLREAVQQFI